MLKKRFFIKAQSLLEIATFLAIVSLAILAMQIYMQRGLQGKTKDLTDAIINPEHLAQRGYTAEEATSSDTTTVSGTTTTSTVRGGSVTKTTNETTKSISESWSKDKIDLPN